MLRIAAIAVAGVMGAAALLTVQAELRRAETEVAAVGETSDEESRMRLCLGPARVTLGGRPYARLAFGGEGCSRHVANVVGFGVLRSRAAATMALGFPQTF
jgi:hypothetical protein